MKIIFSFFIAFTAIGQENWLFARSVVGDPSAIELRDQKNTIRIRTGGNQTAPSIALERDGLGIHMAVLKGGGILSLYRGSVTGGENRAWLRLSYSGIEVADEGGEMKRAFTGTIRPGCAAVVTEGIITGEDCGNAVYATMPKNTQNAVLYNFWSSVNSACIEIGSCIDRDLVSTLSGGKSGYTMILSGQAPPTCVVEFTEGQFDCR